MEHLREEVELKEERPPATIRKAIGDDEKEVKESNVSYVPKPQETWVSINKQTVKANTTKKTSIHRWAALTFLESL